MEVLDQTDNIILPENYFDERETTAEKDKRATQQLAAEDELESKKQVTNSDFNKT